ncbi:MAG: hypothetical protein K2X68_10835 [Novosphingobium sp.]|nr:hypothetical protein [Novosphingobium sp.]
MIESLTIAALCLMVCVGMLWKIARQRRLGTTDNSLHYYPVADRLEKPGMFKAITISDYIVAAAFGVVAIVFVIKSIGLSIA